MRTSFLASAAAALVMMSTAGFSVANAADTLPLVRVQQLSGDDCANAFYAQDLGYFKNNGVDVEISQISNGPVAVQAVAGGAAEIAVANAATVAAARLRGIPLRFIAAAGIAAPTAAEVIVMVPKDSTVKTAVDLNGKIWGVNAIKALPQLSVQTWMDKHGGDSKTVKYVEIPPPEMGAALASHRVDAAVVFEPFATRAREGARSLGTANDGFAPNFLLCGYVATDAWLATHADTASRFVRALRQASEWGNAHHPESGAILAKWTKIEPATIAAMARAVYGTTVTAAMIDPVISAAVKYGVIEKMVPVTDMVWKNPNP